MRVRQPSKIETVCFSSMLAWLLWLVCKALSEHVPLLPFNNKLTEFLIVSSERPIFLRERASKNYDTSAYYWARAAAEIPLLVIQPVLLVMPSYYVIGLHNPAYKYFVMSKLTFLNQT